MAATPAKMASAAVIRVRSGSEPPSPIPSGKPLVRLFGVSGWMTDDGSVQLHGSAAGVHGRIDLDAKDAGITLPPGDRGAVSGEVFTTLTITAALLLGRLQRTLIHAAAAVDPEGGCWLLVGDTHAGKTTTTINLVRGGWSFLSDDHVVARLGSEGPEIEGWPRPFHVDEGWHEGQIAGRRGSVEPREFGTDRWLCTAPLAGLLFPQVRRDEPTQFRRMESAAALSLIIRQTPWLMVDPAAARNLLALLTKMSTLPAYHLSVGRDSYADSEILLRRFAAR